MDNTHHKVANEVSSQTPNTSTLGWTTVNSKPGCSQYLWESREVTRCVYRPRTGKTKIANRWGARAAPVENSGRCWEGLGPIQTGSDRVLWLALNYGLSKPTSQGSPPGMDPTGSRINREQEWCFRLIQPAHKSRQKTSCRPSCWWPSLPSA